MTCTYARHVASDTLFKKFQELGDKFIEIYIGRYERPKFLKKDLQVGMTMHTDTNITDYMDVCYKYLAKELGDYISDKDVDMWSIRDELLGEINQARYLFTMK